MATNQRQHAKGRGPRRVGLTQLALSTAVVMIAARPGAAQNPAVSRNDINVNRARPGLADSAALARDSARVLDGAAARQARGGHYDAALELWKKAALLEPDDLAAHFNAGMMYEFTYHAADALQEFQTAYRLKPAPQMLYHLGVSFHNVGVRDSSLKWFRAAIAANPRDVASWGYAALTEAEMGRDSAALIYWGHALRLEPHYFDKAEAQMRPIFEHSLAVVKAQRRSIAKP